MLIGHLNHIKKLTNDLCICPILGEETKQRLRKIDEFFEDKKMSGEFEPASFLEVFHLMKYQTHQILQNL